MDVLTVSVMLLIAGYPDTTDLDESALDIVEACGIGPLSRPNGHDCWASTVAIWATETRRGFQRFPRAVSGCGPMQVLQPRSCFHNTRIGRQCAPPCESLRVPKTGFEWGVRIFRWKFHRAKGTAAAFKRYNGNKAIKRCGGKQRMLMECYQRSAVRTFSKVKEIR